MKKSLARWGVIMSLPLIIQLLVFFLFPVIFSGYVSFTSWNLFNPPRFTGLRNWINLFGNKNFLGSIRNVLYFAVIFVPLQTFLALIFAYLLNRSIPGRGFFRAVFFLPSVTPWVAVALIFKFIFAKNFGILNYVLGLVGVEPIDWLGSRSWFIVIASVALIQVWKGVGQSMILLLAGMQNVSADVIEAARVDGANNNQIFFKIITPLITPMIFLVMIMSTISAFTAFDGFLAIFDINALRPEQLVPNLFIYSEAFVKGSYGLGSSAAWVLFVIILVITGLQRKYESKWVHYES